MKIAYVCCEDEGSTDRVIAAVADRATAEGIRLVGTVQTNDPDRADEKCLIILELLPDRERRNISVDLEPGVTGCRLDPEALEQAVLVVENRLPSAQALFVNKFGKQEVAGRGLVSAIGEATARRLPVLVGVAPQWRSAFLEFTEGHALALPTEDGAILDWLRQALASTELHHD